jgi:VCBS repeat protein/FG-GAP repeat protein
MRRASLIALLGAALLVTQAAGSTGLFVEPTRVLYTIQGETPPNGCTTACFGWAGSELGDVDRDGVGDWITSEPFTTNGSTYVYSGRKGQLVHRFDGAVAGAQQGYAIADAGDTNGDGTTDILTTAPADGPGHVYIYSGRTGHLLHDLSGEHAGDFFGSAVASAGDVDRDHRPDVLVGAELNADAALRAGKAYVFSGRTGALIRELQVGDQGDLFGSAVDWSEDLNGDHVPDHIVGARGGGLVGPGNGPGQVYVFSGRTGELLFDIDPVATSVDLGFFFVAGVGDVNRDRTPDVYAADFNDATHGPTTGRAGVYSGKDGTELLSWTGSAALEGLGPGREAGDVNRDRRPDLAIGSYNSSEGAPSAGKIQIFSGRDGAELRSITSLTAGEQLGFDAVGIGDVNRDGRPDLLATAANGETVYVLAGNRQRPR